MITHGMGGEKLAADTEAFVARPQGLMAKLALKIAARTIPWANGDWLVRIDAAGLHWPLRDAPHELLLPWSELKEIVQKNMLGSPMLYFVPEDLVAFASRHPMVQKMGKAYFDAFTDSPFTISKKHYADLEEIVRQVHRFADIPFRKG